MTFGDLSASSHICLVWKKEEVNQTFSFQIFSLHIFQTILIKSDNHNDVC